MGIFTFFLSMLYYQVLSRRLSDMITKILNNLRYLSLMLKLSFSNVIWSSLKT